MASRVDVTMFNRSRAAESDHLQSVPVVTRSIGVCQKARPAVQAGCSPSEGSATALEIGSGRFALNGLMMCSPTTAYVRRHKAERSHGPAAAGGRSGVGSRLNRIYLRLDERLQRATSGSGVAVRTQSHDADAAARRMLNLIRLLRLRSGKSCDTVVAWLAESSRAAYC